MKKINLDFKGEYESAVEFIRDNFTISEPTEFEFTRIFKTNAKQRKLKEFKNVYEYERPYTITLNNDDHKENLFKKVCVGTVGTKSVNFEAMGID